MKANSIFSAKIKDKAVVFICVFQCLLFGLRKLISRKTSILFQGFLRFLLETESLYDGGEVKMLKIENCFKNFGLSLCRRRLQQISGMVNALKANTELGCTWVLPLCCVLDSGKSFAAQ